MLYELRIKNIMKRLFIVFSLVMNITFAQISFDRTRIIFDHSESNSQSVIANNTNAAAPFLAQAWLEDEKGNKISGPLVALPILQRINPLQEKPIKISMMGDISALPTDKETLLYFNVLGVPPKDKEGANAVNFVMQSKLKLFYRPKGLPRYKKTMGWLDELQVQKTSGGLMINNPSAYHIIIIGASSGAGNKAGQSSLDLKPFSNATLPIKVSSNTPRVFVVDDFGGVKTLEFRCSGNSCTQEN